MKWIEGESLKNVKRDSSLFSKKGDNKGIEIEGILDKVFEERSIYARFRGLI